jgi:hypothetical protein
MEFKPPDWVFLWFTDAAATNGKEIEERSEEGRVRRKAEENSLAV